MAAVVGEQADVESLVTLKDFMNRLGCERLCTEERLPTGLAGCVQHAPVEIDLC